MRAGDWAWPISGLTQGLKQRSPPSSPCPEPFEFRGRDAIAAFYRTQGLWGQPIKLVPTNANHQPAFGYYLPDPHVDILRAGGVLVLAVAADQISAITRFADRGLLVRFGLPRTMPST